LSDNLVAPVPNPPNTFPNGQAAWVAERHPEAVTKAAVLAPDIETTNVQVERMVRAYEAVGFEFVYRKKTGALQESYATEAAEMKRLGVEWVTMISPVSETVKLLDDMRTQSFEPEVVDLGQQYYDPELLASPASEGAIVQLNTVPFEEVDESPALQTYVEAYEAVGSSVPATSLGVQAFSAGLLFATAMRELGDDITREGLLDELRTITSWDGGGLHFETNPGDNLGSACFMYAEVRDGEFVRLWPEEVTTWQCDEAYRFELGEDFGGGATAGG
jgi:ABC-type branched-subunit amino acid transport system substrate-binding protein